MHLDRPGLERLAERLGIAFYLVMLVAFLTAVSGAPGVGLFLMIVGAVAHVARATIEEFIAKNGRSARLDLRLPSLARLKPPQSARPAPSSRSRR